jgi:hypothetical protein
VSRPRNVHVRVTDADTGRPTPVRIRFGGPDGAYYPAHGRPADFPVGRNEDVGGHVYLNGKRYAYIDGGAEYPLPTGVPLTVEISKGPAYTPIRESVILGEGQLTLRFSIRRWTGDEWRDLIATDSRCHSLTPHSARLEAAAEGLDLVNLLVTVQDYPSPDGHSYRVIPNMTAFSGQSPALDCVYVNTLNVHPALGRLALLNCHRAVFPLTFGHADEADDWSLSDWADQCHRKGGLVVWCNAYQSDTGLPGGEALVSAILGKVEALEVDAADRTPAVLPVWYRLLNAGLRLPLVGGSGKASNRIAIGAVRTLTPPSPNGYAGWVNHVRAGRSVVTTGPYLRLTVNDEAFNTRVAPPTGTPIRVRAEAASVVPFDRLELIANGAPIASSTAGTESRTATVEAEVNLPEGGWVAARCWGPPKSELYPHVPVFAHTSPAWIEPADAPPVRQANAVMAVAKDVMSVRNWIESDGRFTDPKRRTHLLALCDAAAARLAGPA